MDNLDIDIIRAILENLRRSYDLFDFLSEQEIERLAESLVSVFVNTDNQPQADYISWSNIVREKIINELNSLQEYFGIRNLVQRFPTDDFLRAYHGMLIKK